MHVEHRAHSCRQPGTTSRMTRARAGVGVWFQGAFWPIVTMKASSGVILNAEIVKSIVTYVS